jgi:amidase/aspartyl-tRNA(Asn)/glutamyl-tRNA(Gln) amidotransferase subunit A
VITQRARFAEKLDVAGVDDVVAAGDKNSNHAPLWRSRLAPREKIYPPVSQPMHFSDWQSLAPAPAAREFLRRATTLLSPAQQRAVFAQLPTEAELIAHFATAPAGAPLAGVPYLAKDLFDVAGFPTFAGSTFLPEVRPDPTTDSAFIRAVNAAGGVLAGKTHLHEFAYGITGENPHYGDVEHPRFSDRTTGGSSSGSAAAVAAGVVPFALGTDTGGSIRVPAAFCGLYGFRGAPRQPWIVDAFPLAPSFDTAGWFTTTAVDMRTALSALIGLGTSTRTPRGCYLEIPGLSAEVAAACRAAAARLAPPADTATRTELLRRFAGALDAYNIIVALEASAVHAAWSAEYKDRYDPTVWTRLNRVHEFTPAQVASADAMLTPRMDELLSHLRFSDSARRAPPRADESRMHPSSTQPAPRAHRARLARRPARAHPTLPIRQRPERRFADNRKQPPKPRPTLGAPVFLNIARLNPAMISES